MEGRLLKLLYCVLATTLLIAGCTLSPPSKLPTIYHQFAESQPNYCYVENGRIEYYRLGNGSPILLIEGYASDISSWNRKFLAVLAAQHEVIVFNNRNMGRSTIHSLRYDSKALAEDTHLLIQHLKLNKPTVVGISMGGMIAQQLAASYPNEVGRLILINTAIAGKKAIHPNNTVKNYMVHMPTDKIARYELAMQLFFPKQWRTRASVALLMDHFHPKHFSYPNPSSTTMRQQLHLVMDWVNDDITAKRIEKLPMPVLILNGKSDAVIPPINSDILAHRIPHAWLMRWQEGGHAMIYQFPQEMGQIINQFIAHG